MFLHEDHTYSDIKEKSFMQWLEEMERHEDVAVRSGVNLARMYIQSLKEENTKLSEENQLKNEYLKKMAKKNKEA